MKKIVTVITIELTVKTSTSLTEGNLDDILTAAEDAAEEASRHPRRLAVVDSRIGSVTKETR